MNYLYAVVVALVLLLSPLPAFASETIDVFDVVIAVNSDGTINVTEKIAYDFGDLDRHGMYRDIPFVKTNDSGKRYAMDFSEVRSSDPFTESVEGEMIRWKIGDPGKTITGEHTYTIGYRVKGALTYFSGHDELYWNATGNNWQVPIAASSVTVTFPSDAAREDVHIACYTGQVGSTESKCDAKIVDARTVNVTTKEALESYEGLTIVVGFPKRLATVLEPRELVPFFDTLLGKVVLILLGIGAILWYVFTPVWVIRKWWTGGRDPKPAMGEVTAWFSPPKTPKGRDLTPAETGTLVDERADLRDIYASIVDLARRGYLRIIEMKKNVFDLEKTKDWVGDKEALPFERELLTGLFKENDRVSIKSLDVTKTLEKVKSMLYDSLVADTFFPTNPNTLRGWYIALAVLSFIFFNPVLLLVSLTFGLHMPKKTLFGAEAAVMARSLRNFLTSQEEKLAFQAKNQMMFEKLLPYAVAFGVEEIWAERFKDLKLTHPDWYVSSTGGRFQSVAFAHAIGQGLSVSFTASISSHSSRGFSSGFSSGGSSGGGGGGGGGGSW